jgi:glycerol-3-phosphate dehydrogenase (NAD(P)+)
MNISVLGAGSWGTALANVISDNGYRCLLWSHNEDEINEMKKTRKNSRYLPDAEISGNVVFTSDLAEAVENVDVLVVAVPSQAVRSVLKRLRETASFLKPPIMVNVSKGIENGTLKLMSDVFEEFYPECDFVVLSGPSHAEEVIRRIPTTIVSSSKSSEAAKVVQDIFTNSYMRIYTNQDVVGVELCGALKNIIALGAGISDGLGYGDNTKAALMTRGIAEIARLGKKLGAKSSTFLGLAGMGDLIVTCTSMHSRNRRCGILIGEGKSVDEAVKSIGMVVEGFYTVQSAYELSQKHGVDMPITEELYNVLYKGQSAKASVMNLMLRDKKNESEDIDEWNI